jgi:hypothetical protein
MQIRIYVDDTGYFTLIVGPLSNGEQIYKLEDYAWYVEGENVGLVHKYTKQTLFSASHYSEWVLDGTATGDMSQLTDYLKTNFKPGGSPGEGGGGSKNYKELKGYLSQQDDELPTFRIIANEFNAQTQVQNPGIGIFSLSITGITFDLNKVVFIGTSNYANREDSGACFEALTWDKTLSSTSELILIHNIESIVNTQSTNNFQELLIIIQLYN